MAGQNLFNFPPVFPRQFLLDLFEIVLKWNFKQTIFLLDYLLFAIIVLKKPKSLIMKFIYYQYSISYFENHYYKFVRLNH
jgi:hypothetical protein